MKSWDNLGSMIAVGFCFLALIMIYTILSGIPSATPILAKERKVREEELLIGMKVICLDGYEYFFSVSGDSAVLAPRFDLKNDKPKQCYLPPLEDDEEEDE